MTERLRVLIVDDEPLARENLRGLLGADPDVIVVGECASGRAALSALRAQDVDLVFLDVRMPRLSGLDVVREVGAEAMPLVIFTTAFDRYALEAFAAQALDYLLKPFDDERFAQALARAKTSWRQGRDAQLARRLASLVERLGPQTSAEPAASPVPPASDAGAPDRLLVKQRGRMVPVEVAQIDWVEAADYCVRLHVGERTYTLRESMNALAERLGEQRFLRVHRSAIVRLDRVSEVQSAQGSAWVTLVDGTRLPLSRRRKLLLERRLRG